LRAERAVQFSGKALGFVKYLIPDGFERFVMASKKQVVELIAMQCTECKRRNYTTSKNRRNLQEKLELRKYCPFERKHTLHKETKIK
jgi:large subunit ribosomal protein L33